MFGRNSKGNAGYEAYLKEIEEKLSECPDISRKKVTIDGNKKAFFIYIEGLVNMELLQKNFILPALSSGFAALSDKSKVYNLPAGVIKLIYETDSIIPEIMTGNVLFICQDIEYAVSCRLDHSEKRSLDEPVSEKNQRGPHIGFIEQLGTNIAILRRSIKSAELKFKIINLDNSAKQTIAIAYMSSLADMQIVEDLSGKINNISSKQLIIVKDIEMAAADYPNSLFPQFLETERPDRVIAQLMRGGIAVLLDGTPEVLTAPMNFFSFLYAMDDKSIHWIHGTFLRLLRFLALFLAILLPSLYIGITSYNYYTVPLTLLVTLAESRAKVPFPPLIEVLILEITVDLIREASVRLPTYVGASVSVVAGLIIGQAAVEAGVVSNLLIIVVASTTVAAAVIPSFNMALAIRILRYIFILAAGIFGMIGIIVCFMLTFAHLVVLESFGQPYLQPVIPLKPGSIKAIIKRVAKNISMSLFRTAGEKQRGNRSGNNGEQP